jgi:PAS domain S-box-containing protein
MRGQEQNGTHLDEKHRVARDFDVPLFFEFQDIGVIEVHGNPPCVSRVNAHFADMIGASADELRGMNIARVFAEADEPERSSQLGQWNGNGHVGAFETDLCTRNGALLRVKVNVAVLPDSNGGAPGRLALIEDITDRVRCERNATFLAELEDSFAGLSDLDAILAVASERLCAHLAASRVSFTAIGDANEAVLLKAHCRSDRTHTGAAWRLAEFLSEEFIHELDAGRSVAISDVAADPRTSPVAEALRRAGCGAVVHAPYAAGGRCRFVGAVEHVTTYSWRSDEIQVLRDLTHRVWLLLERVRAQRALRDSETRLRRVTEIETVGIVFFNLRGDILDANDAFLSLTGYSREEVRLRLVSWEAVTAPEQRPQARQALKELAAKGRIEPFEKECVTRNGQRRWVLAAATRLSADEATEFLIDISERKRFERQVFRGMEQLEERVIERTAELDALNGALRDEIIEGRRGAATRQALMSQLVAAQEEERRRISRDLHDNVGQHLTALMLGLKSLESRYGIGPVAETLRDLQQLSETIGKEIHDLALELRPTSLDDLGLVRTLSNFVGDWSGRTGVQVDFHTGGWAGGDRLPADIETTIYRVVSEAFNNVLKHARAKRVSLIIERRADQAVAIVEDDGRGFDVAVASKASEKRLGLTNMRERAALVNGELNIESAPGRGTTVFLRVPLVLPPEPPPPPFEKLDD